jgi:hypothetical protein
LKKRYPKPTHFRPKNISKYVGDPANIISRSSYEWKFMNWCDNNPSVLKWGSEIYPIEYFSKIHGKTRRYFVDFFVQIRTRDNTIQNLAIEIKPYSQTIPPKKSRNERTYINEMVTWQVNNDKWNAATEWAGKNGFQFLIMTEKQLGIKS